MLNLVHHEEVLWINENEYNVFPAIKIEEGYGYSELKDQVAIFHFTGKKPWTGGNHIHFDTEKIWWDYALKTCYKDVFLEEFVLNSLEDMSMREYVRELIRENLQLKTDLQAVVESMQKVMSRIDNN